MYINQSFTTFQALVPLSEYKGPILKLTKSDKAKIKELSNTKASLELDLYNIENILKEKKLASELNWYNNLYDSILYKIEYLNEQIKQIKIDRKNQQLNALKKS